MADEDLDLDVEKSGKKPTKLIVIILIVVVLLLGGVVAFLMLGGDKSDAEGEKSDEQQEAELTPSNAIYLALKPTFIVNFADSSKVAYLQTDISVMAVKQSVLDQVQEKMPVIRNDILFILGAESYESLGTAQGKEQLREKVRDAINATLSVGHEATETDEPASKEDGQEDKHGEAETGDDAGPTEDQVQQVYFTSFIMQ